jgi:hypothetical protein
MARRLSSPSGGRKSAVAVAVMMRDSDVRIPSDCVEKVLFR